MNINTEDYNIIFGSISESLSATINKIQPSQIAILVDENTKTHCLDRLGLSPGSYSLIEILSGEQNKNLDTCSSIWKQMAHAKLDRHSLMLNLGGGVIGDMGGYCASCYMRGINFIQIPTSLLSQVDASIGGKLGIDFEGMKNFIGLFNHPKSIFIDEQFLETLPKLELRSGFAEVIKHYLIADKHGWIQLESGQWNQLNWAQEVHKSILIKNRIVQSDPLEKGLRKILNFGHSIGHALESCALQTEMPLLHGEAIALGMIAESYLSHKKSGLGQTELDQIASYIISVYPELNSDHILSFKALQPVLIRDKKNFGNKMMFSLLRQIGDCGYDIEVSASEIQASLDYLSDLYKT